MAQFKSFARVGSVQPIELPDVAAQFEKKAAKELQYLKENAAYSAAQDKRMADAIANVQRVEEDSRKRNYEIEQDSKQRIQNQIRQNYEISIKNNVDANKDQLKTLEALSAFSTKAGDILKGVYDNIEEGRRLTVHQALYRTGLSYSELMELHKLDRNMTDQALAENAFIKEILGRPNVSIQEIRYLMKHSRASYWNDSVALAQGMGSNYLTEVNQNLNTEFMFEGKPITLAQARDSGDDRSLKYVLNNIRSNYMKSSGMLNMAPQVVAQHAHPLMQSVEAQLTLDTNNQFKKLAANKAQESEFNAFYQLEQQAGFQSLWSWFNAQPDKALGKSKILGYMLQRASSSPDAVSEMLMQMGKTNTVVNGKEIPLVDLWGPQLIEIQKAVTSTTILNKQQDTLKESEEDDAYEDRIKDLITEGLVQSQADVEAIKKDYFDTYGRVLNSPYLDEFSKNYTTNAKFIKEKVNELEKRASLGILDLDTYNRLSLGLPTEIQSRYQGIAAQTEKQYEEVGGLKTYYEMIGNLVKSPPEIANRSGNAEPHWSVTKKEAEMQSKFKNLFDKYRLTMDAGQAADAAFGVIKGEFAEMMKNPNAVSKSPGSFGGYADIISRDTSTQAKAANRRLAQIDLSIKRNGKNLQAIATETWTRQQLESVLKNAARPGWSPNSSSLATHIARRLDVTPYSVFNAALSGHGLGKLPMPAAFEASPTSPNPMLLKKLQQYATTPAGEALSDRTMISTKVYREDLVPKSYGPMVTAAATAAGINPTYLAALAHAENGSWDANIFSGGGYEWDGVNSGVGLMQLSQDFHGVGVTVQEREQSLKNPELNLRLGAGILSNLYRKYGNWKDTIYAWNMGETGYARWQAAGSPKDDPQAKKAAGLYQRFDIQRARYGDVQALRSRNTMRQSMRRYGSVSFERPSSVVFETANGQPGVDLYFESKRFPAVLDGVVKDVSREPGYGNYIVIESTDPATGQKVDVLYAHLADGPSIRPGQQIEAGDIIGTQGGTGNVRSVDGTIASIDFLAPAPRGSKSMEPYAGYQNLRNYVVSQLQR